MRIFLALLLALLFADTMTGSSARRSRREKGKSRESDISRESSSEKLLKKLKDKFEKLEKAEEDCDDEIEAKMEEAVNRLGNSVAEMHQNLNTFIDEDKIISNNLKIKIDDMSTQVTGLEDTILDIIQKQECDEPEVHGIESKDKDVAEDEIQEQEQRGDIEDSSNSGEGFNEDEDAAPAQNPIEETEAVYKRWCWLWLLW